MSSLNASRGLLDESRAQSLFVCSAKLLLFDHFRTPYLIDPSMRTGDLEQLGVADTERLVLWHRGGGTPASAATV
ncbi:MAG: hypothetical protein ACYCXW_23410, partial [Solirubrobacteraceae bacterium]